MTTKETPEQLRIRRLLYNFPYSGGLGLVSDEPMDYTFIAGALEKLSDRIRMASADHDRTTTSYTKLRSQVLGMRELLNGKADL